MGQRVITGTELISGIFYELFVAACTKGRTLRRKEARTIAVDPVERKRVLVLVLVGSDKRHVLYALPNFSRLNKTFEPRSCFTTQIDEEESTTLCSLECLCRAESNGVPVLEEGSRGSQLGESSLSTSICGANAVSAEVSLISLRPPGGASGYGAIILF